MRLLLLDYDEGRERPELSEIVYRLKRAGYSIRQGWERPSPGGGEGAHVRLELDPEPRDPMEVVALQAVLGSDPWREACNVMRVRNLDGVGRYWRERWNVLYRGNGADGRPADWRPLAGLRAWIGPAGERV